MKNVSRSYLCNRGSGRLDNRNFTGQIKHHCGNCGNWSKWEMGTMSRALWTIIAFERQYVSVLFSIFCHLVCILPWKRWKMLRETIKQKLCIPLIVWPGKMCNACTCVTFVGTDKDVQKARSVFHCARNGSVEDRHFMVFLDQKAGLSSDYFKCHYYFSLQCIWFGIYIFILALCSSGMSSSSSVLSLIARV